MNNAINETFGLETFQSFADKNRGVPYERLRESYDREVTRRKEEAKRLNDQARDRRLAAEAKAKSETEAQRQAEDAKKREAALAEMKQKAKGVFMLTPAASAEDFERLWPQLRDQMLLDEARSRDEAIKARMRSGQYAF